MYLLKGTEVTKIEEKTFSELHMKEEDLEKILRKNVDMVCDDDESLLLVGEQVENRVQARSDLTAVDQDGNLVLIELKRDKKDIEQRKEPLEFQAIRYAASCATIENTDALIRNVFAPYIEKHRAEFREDNLSAEEIARQRLSDFIDKNGIDIESFNAHQRIILVASEFDEQTLSASAWLLKNGIDITCYKMALSEIKGEMYINPVKLLPTGDCEEYYIGFKDRNDVGAQSGRQIVRRSLPNIKKLLEWGVVHAGDTITARGKEEEAVLQADGTVIPQGQAAPCSLQQWLKGVFGWAAVDTYVFSVQKQSGKTLYDLRREYMERQESEQSDL